VSRDAIVGDRGVTRAEALRVWVRVALLSFGGPAGQIAVMHRIVVEERRWIDEERFLHCMSYCMLLPGPEAQQLATYLGWLLHGTRGGLIAGTIFILPGFLSILFLSVLYAEFKATTLLAGVFFGLKCGVTAVVLQALLRIGRRARIRGPRLLLAAAAFVAIFFLRVPFPVIVASAALLGFLGRRWIDSPVASATSGSGAGVGRRPSTRVALRTAAVWALVWFVPVCVLVVIFGTGSVFVDEALFFSKTAVVTFGGAYAVLTYIAHQAVESFAWLAPGEMIDGLGLAETTPGPLIQVVQFVGYLAAYRDPGGLSPVAAGLIGSAVTTWVTFVPCFLFVFVGAPFAEYLRSRAGLRAALGAITAAIVGVVLNLAVWFAMHTLFAEVANTAIGPARFTVPVWGSVDAAAVVLVALSGVALRLRVGMLPTLGGTAVLGLAIRLLLP